jgi:hypothetical protein
VIRERFGRIYHLIRDMTGASVEEARRFMATGMLLTVMAAMQIAGSDALDCSWAADVMANLEDVGDQPTRLSISYRRTISRSGRGSWRRGRSMPR